MPWRRNSRRGNGTIYRDIAALVERQGSDPWRGHVGYVFERGYDLPPLILTSGEVEAVTLGPQSIIAHADPGLSRAALAVLAKSAAIVPEDLRPL